MHKKSLFILLTLFLLCYLAALSANPLAYIISFAVFFYGTFTLLALNLSWRLLPSEFKAKYIKHQIMFSVIIVGCLALMFLVWEAIDRFYFRDSFYLIKISTEAVLVFFIAFFGWNFIKGSRINITAVCVLILFLFILFAPVIKSFKTGAIVKNESSSMKDLQTLPYLSWVPMENSMDKAGVTIYDPNSSFKGLNLYVPRGVPVVSLMDMSGNMVHTWSLGEKYIRGLVVVELCENGDLLGYADEDIIRLDWNSNMKRQESVRVHHDFCVAENGDIYLVTRKDEVIFFYGLPVPLRNNYIELLAPNGKIKKRISLFHTVKNQFLVDIIPSIYRDIIKPRNIRQFLKRKITKKHIFKDRRPFDILHANTVEIIDRDIDGLCKKGDLLISIRQLNFVGILDIEKEEYIWSWGPGNIIHQHHPTLLPNGNILIFDNGSHKKASSRVVELNPINKKIVWEYKGRPEKEFFSNVRGSNQRLPNGNTLITESDKGRVFEVTKRGKIVWEFYSPDMTKNNKRAAIYRMSRITNPETYPYLKQFLD